MNADDTDLISNPRHPCLSVAQSTTHAHACASADFNHSLATCLVEIIAEPDRLKQLDLAMLDE
ncbi:MAG TPA: hypothetical protein VJ875_08690 [Pyrinomonadaceae bacterium]|nr:hypothetical protein [Pyrinomonadaceae bacterium]